MAKELPYFQFEPAEYLTKDISFCSLSAQGLFINLCSYYWQRECKLTKEQLLRRLNYPKELQELIDENVISVNENVISVSFLDEQYKIATDRSNINKINGSKGGRPKKEKQNKSKIKANGKQKESKTKGIREDKIILDKIIKDNISSFEEQKIKIINDWFDYRKSIKKTIVVESTVKTLVNRFIKEDLNKCKWVVNNSIENGYQGLFWDNYKKSNNTKSNTMTMAEKRESLSKPTF